MTLRCKPGDLAIHICPCVNLGKIFSIISKDYEDDLWVVECLGLATTSDGELTSSGLMSDSKLRPLRGDISNEKQEDKQELTA